MHTSVQVPWAVPIRENLHVVLESLGRGGYEVVWGDTKLEDCGSVEAEMRNGVIGVNYVKHGWGGPQL